MRQMKQLIWRDFWKETLALTYKHFYQQYLTVEVYLREKSIKSIGYTEYWNISFKFFCV